MDTKGQSQKTFTSCPVCGQRIAIKGEPGTARRFACTHCGAELKVINADPLKLGTVHRA